jgi:hypothetical protein
MDTYRVEINYGSITKAYGERFGTIIEAAQFAKSKEIYPAFVKADIIKVDKCQHNHV